MSDREDPLREEGLTKGAAKDISIVAKGGAVQVVGQFSQRILSLVFTMAFLRILSKSLYGVYRQVAQILAITAQLGLAGFNYASMRFITKARAAGDHGTVKGAARVGLAGAGVFSFLIFAVLMIFAPAIVHPFADHASDEPYLSFLLRVGAIYVPLFAATQVLRYCTQAYKTMVPSVMVGNIIQPGVRFLLGVGLLIAGFSVTGAVSTLAASTGVAALAAAFYFRRMLTEAERHAAPTAPVREMVRFALPQAGASIFGIQTLGLGIILTGIFSSNAQVGIFGVALMLQGPGNIFLGSIVNIWAPMVSDLHEKGQIKRLGSLYQTINRWIATFSFPVYAALIIIPDWFVHLFAGSHASGAAPVVAVLAVGNIFYSGTGPTGFVISMTGRPMVNFINSVIAVALYVLLGWWIVPEHGALGMAIVDSSVTAVINSVRVLEAWMLVGIQPFGRSYIKPVLATLAGSLVLLGGRFIVSDSMIAETAALGASVIVFLVVLAALGMDQEERYVWDRIRKRVFKRGNKAATP